ncbi:DegT/DnrJ/EryC1/StrS aminotransferase family protein [Thermoactinomyces sp. DSM 45892]|uniref:DegT/DnrJ/EryC1/StrS family aminotransferase n=1 Tax=Thermoactinomyces sp. DSM 45892 TaxID=1882753 RepID=UPI000B8261D9|nr:aminotransferase class I/II-fold pyridoxal phosphate-dependent enzyme [Thermoactinomyces sp. DSM 45892]
MKQIPFLRPNVVRCELYLKYLSQIDENRIYSNYGPLNDTFEERILQEFFEGEGAVSTVNNATIGLMLAISESMRPNGRYALMPSFTFSATPLAAIWCGLEPYFIDIREDEWSMNVDIVEDTLKNLGDQVAVVVPYATFGTCIDLTYYNELQKKGIPVVVDAAASFGARDAYGHFGKGFLGSIIYSFHATKGFGIGEGGLVYSGDQGLISNVRQAGNFGYKGSKESTLKGLNSKLSEYMAAIGLATLDVFEQKVESRKQIKKWYLEQMDKWNLFEKGWRVQNCSGQLVTQLLSVLSPQGENDRIIHHLGEQGIDTRCYFSPPCHRQKQFATSNQSTMAVTECISDRIISLPFWEEIERDHVKQIVKALANTLHRGE